MHIMNDVPTTWSIFSIFLFSGIGLIIVAAIIASIIYLPARKRLKKEQARVAKLNSSLKRKETPAEVNEKISISADDRGAAATTIVVAAFVIGCLGAGVSGSITATNLRMNALSHNLQVQAKERYGIKLTKADTDVLLGPAKHYVTGPFMSNATVNSQKGKTVMEDSADQENPYQLFGVRDLAKLQESGKVKVTKIQLARVNNEYILTYNGSAGINDVTELPVKK